MLVGGSCSSAHQKIPPEKPGPKSRRALKFHHTVWPLIWVENPVVHPLDEVWPWWAIYYPTNMGVRGTRTMADGFWVHTSLLCFHNYTGLFSQVRGVTMWNILLTCCYNLHPGWESVFFNTSRKLCEKRSTIVFPIVIFLTTLICSR